MTFAFGSLMKGYQLSVSTLTQVAILSATQAILPIQLLVASILGKALSRPTISSGLSNQRSQSCVTEAVVLIVPAKRPAIAQNRADNVQKTPREHPEMSDSAKGAGRPVGALLLLLLLCCLPITVRVYPAGRLAISTGLSGAGGCNARMTRCT